MCALLTFNAFFRLLSNSEKLIHRILRALMPDNLFFCRHVASALPVIAALWLSASGSVWADLTVTYITATPEASYRTSRVYAGTSKAARRAELGFKRGGEISVVAVDLGDTVAAGQAVARLDARGLGSDLRQAQSEQAFGRGQSPSGDSAKNSQRIPNAAYAPCGPGAMFRSRPLMKPISKCRPAPRNCR